jgi:hypothetical protein
LHGSRYLLHLRGALISREHILNQPVGEPEGGKGDDENHGNQAVLTAGDRRGGDHGVIGERHAELLNNAVRAQGVGVAQRLRR